MNEDRITGNWKKFSGKVREQSGKLADENMYDLAGKPEKLARKM